MSAIKGIYETLNKDTLVRDYLHDSCFDGSLIVVKNANGLRNNNHEFMNNETAIYYIREEEKCLCVHDAILYVTTLFNEFTKFETKQGNKVSLHDLAEKLCL